MNSSWSIINGKYYFGDTTINSNEYHGVDVSNLLTSMNQIISSVSWTVPDSLNHNPDNDFIDSTNNTVGLKINPTETGRFKIVLNLTTQFLDNDSNPIDRYDTVPYNIYINIIK